MDESKISRRDALRLGQMGLLLGTGLGLTSLANAGQLATPAQRPLRPVSRGRYIIKFYRSTGVEAEMMAWAETDFDLQKVFAEREVRGYWKFFGPTAEGKPETLGVIENIHIKLTR